jgi:hypothetical protein
MRHYVSTEEFVWYEKIAADTEIGIELIAVQAEELNVLNALYNSKKPIVLESDVYQYISMDVSEDSGSYWGILNCRVNNEHVQVRF